MSQTKNQVVNRLLFGGGILFDLCKWIILAAVILTLVHKFLFTIFVVDGLSMEPTIHDRELILLKRYKTATLPARGNVVAVKYPGDPDHKKYIKRVVGLPGNKIKVTDGKVYIDGALYIESYIPYGVTSEPSGEWDLGDNEYFLMGDNRPGSNDSRYFGPVEKRFFLGQASTIIYPRLRDISKL